MTLYIFNNIIDLNIKAKLNIIYYYKKIYQLKLL